jgi:hypothetical protein
LDYFCRCHLTISSLIVAGKVLIEALGGTAAK